MSQDVVARIIGKALADAKFRRHLFADPNAALAGYRLTQDEVEAIRRGLEAGEDSGRAAELEPRVSRAQLPLDAISSLLSAAGIGFKAAPDQAASVAGQGGATEVNGSPVPHPVPHEAHDVGAMPEPIPHPADAGAVGAMPEPISHPADAGAVGAMPEPIHHPGGGVLGAGTPSSSPTSEPVPQPTDSGGDDSGSTESEPPPGRGEWGSSSDKRPAESPFPDDEDVQADEDADHGVDVQA